MLTIDLRNVSTTLHSDSDVNASKTLLPKQQHRLQKLEIKKNYILNEQRQIKAFPTNISRVNQI